MLSQGLLEEAAQVQKNTGAQTSIQAIGYKELFAYLKGERPLNDCVEELKRSTRRYAKRQLSWFKRDKRFHWLYVDDYESMQDMLDAAQAIIQQEVFDQ